MNSARLWLRPFLPSWRFFASVEVVPQLWLRSGTNKENYSEWQPLLVAVPRRWWNLFVNSQVNLWLWRQTLLMQLIDDVQSLPSITSTAVAQLSSYQAVVDWVKTEVTSLGAADKVSGEVKNLKSHPVFQFKITVLKISGETEVVLQSPDLNTELAK